MGGFLKALAKVGLVELEESDRQPAPATRSPAGDVDMAELDRLLAETGAELSSTRGGAAPSAQGGRTPMSATMVVTPTGGAMAAPAGSATSQGSAEGLVEGRPFSEIYADASLQPSPFPAEKLIKVLDGLRAMDPGTRRAAVLAMDAADDSWSVDDSVLDAQRKIRVIQSTATAMAQAVNEAAAKASADIQAQETYQAQATESIRKQIADLEALLQEELQKVASEKAGIEARLRATREAFERETARLNLEIERLQEIFRIFSSSGTTGPVSS